MDLPGIAGEIVEFFRGPCLGELKRLGFIQFSSGVKFAQHGHKRFAVLVIAGLEIRALGQVVADVLVVAHTDTANVIDGFVAAVAGGNDEVARPVSGAEERVALHPLWDIDASEVQ